MDNVNLNKIIEDSIKIEEDNTKNEEELSNNIDINTPNVSNNSDINNIIDKINNNLENINNNVSYLSKKKHKNNETNQVVDILNNFIDVLQKTITKNTDVKDYFIEDMNQNKIKKESTFTDNLFVNYINNKIDDIYNVITKPFLKLLKFKKLVSRDIKMVKDTFKFFMHPIKGIKELFKKRSFKHINNNNEKLIKIGISDKSLDKDVVLKRTAVGVAFSWLAYNMGLVNNRRFIDKIKDYIPNFSSMFSITNILSFLKSAFPYILGAISAYLVGKSIINIYSLYKENQNIENFNLSKLKTTAKNINKIANEKDEKRFIKYTKEYTANGMSKKEADLYAEKKSNITRGMFNNSALGILGIVGLGVLTGGIGWIGALVGTGIAYGTHLVGNYISDKKQNKISINAQKGSINIMREELEAKEKVLNSQKEITKENTKFNKNFKEFIDSILGRKSTIEYMENPETNDKPDTTKPLNPVTNFNSSIPTKIIDATNIAMGLTDTKDIKSPKISNYNPNIMSANYSFLTGKLESSFNPKTKSSRNSATGLYQIIPHTFNDRLLKNVAKDLGIYKFDSSNYKTIKEKNKAEHKYLRGLDFNLTDPVNSTIFLYHVTKANVDSYYRRYKTYPSDYERYLMHNYGFSNFSKIKDASLDSNKIHRLNPYWDKMGSGLNSKDEKTLKTLKGKDKLDFFLKSKRSLVEEKANEIGMEFDKSDNLKPIDISKTVKKTETNKQEATAKSISEALSNSGKKETKKETPKKVSNSNETINNMGQQYAFNANQNSTNFEELKSLGLNYTFGLKILGENINIC